MIYNYSLAFFILLIFGGQPYKQYGNTVKGITNPDTSDLLIRNAKVIMLGEAHSQIKHNNMVTVALMKYLNEFHNYRVFVVEFGYADELLFNEYLLTGSDHILRDISGSYETDNGIVDQLKEIYSYNLNRPDDKKIIIRSLDTENNIFVASDILCDEILSYPDTTELLTDIREEATYLKKYLTSAVIIREKKIKKHLNKIHKNFYNVQISANNKIKNDKKYFVIKRLIDGIFYEYFEDENDCIIREKIMLSNFESIVREFPNEKLMMNLGKGHVCKKCVNFRCDSTESMYNMLHLVPDAESNQHIVSVDIQYNSREILLGDFYPIGNKLALVKDTSYTFDLQIYIIDSLTIVKNKR